VTDPTQFKKVKRLRDAVFEAQRFIQRANKAADQIEEGNADWYRHPEFAAAKRASLDLSRSLAELRSSLYD